MKKLFLTSALFLAFTTSAFAQQNVKGDGPRPKPTTEQMMKPFEQLNLSTSQKRKLQKLFKEREANFEKNRPPRPAQKDFAKDEKRPQRPPVDGKRDQERLKFDQKIQKILTKDQFEKFKQQQPHKMGMKDRKAHNEKAAQWKKG